MMDLLTLFPDRNLKTMWRKVGGWTLRHSLLEPVFLPLAKPNLILLPPAKPNLPPCRWRLISCSSPCFGGAKPEKKKPAAAAKTSRAEGTKVPRSKSAVAKYEKMNKVVSVDVWDSMSLADLGNFSITLRHLTLKLGGFETGAWPSFVKIFEKLKESQTFERNLFMFVSVFRIPDP